MIDLLVKVLINAIGVYVAVLIVPQISFPAARHLTEVNDLIKVLGVALILAIINTYLKPILKILSFPITLFSMGLFAFVLNALLLLLVAFLSDKIDHIGFRIGTFPPDLNADAFVGALLGSIVISIVAVGLGLLNRGRRIVT